jgi:hypothetical protein
MTETNDTLNDDLDNEKDLYNALTTITKLYTDKTHLIYELLQNAEDCLAKQVRFIMYPRRLELLHDGRPFTQTNITSLRSVAASDKPVNAIGKFGVGFKSVFSICETVEIYSEPDNYKGGGGAFLNRFANKIEGFRKRFPIPFGKELEKPFTTRFVFPFCVDKDFSGYKTIEGLQEALDERLSSLGADVMLFLKNITSISYEIIGDDHITKSHGIYMLDRKKIGDNCYKITTMGENSESRPNLSYLMYSMPTETTGNTNRSIDIVFSIDDRKDKPVFLNTTGGHRFIYVYFPTETESKLKFIIQAPFATTPNRGGVPVEENRELIIKAAELLEEAVLDIRKRGWLTLDFLNLLPFDNPDKSWIFGPLYNKTLYLLTTACILPTNDGGYTSKEQAVMARGAVRENNITEIFNNRELSLLIGRKSKWMSNEAHGGNFTEINKLYSSLYVFLRDEIGIIEVENQDIPKYLRNNPDFFNSPLINDPWLQKFYNHLSSKVEGTLGKGHAFALVPFIKTSNGEFISAYRSVAKGQFPNIFTKPKNARYNVKDIPLVADFITKNCGEFIEKMGIGEADDYNYFIKELEESGKTPPQNNIPSDLIINQTKNAVKYIRNNTPGIEESCAKWLWLVVTGTNEKPGYAHAETDVVFRETYEGISLRNYFKLINSTVYTLDEGYYKKHGFTDADLSILEKIGIKTNIFCGMKDDPWNDKGITKCCNIDDFRKRLDFENIDDVLKYIRGNPAGNLSKIKSGIIFSLLKTVEPHLKGKWQYGVTRPEYRDGVSLIVEKLIYDKWLFNKNNRLVGPSGISRYDLDNSIYGEVDTHSKIYDILGFAKSDKDMTDELVLRFTSQFTKQEQEDLFKILHIQEEEEEEFDPDIDTEIQTFPEEDIKNINRLKEAMLNTYKNAADVEYKPVLRRVRTSRGKDKEHIGRRYKGFCQMCRTPSYFWEVVEIFNNPRKEIEQMNISLCPNCASKYRRLRNEKETMDAFQDSLIHSRPEKETAIPIGNDSEIQFTRTHLAEIQVILNLEKEPPGKGD